MLSGDKDWLARNVAAAILGGIWNKRALLQRMETFFGTDTRTAQRRLIRELLVLMPAEVPPSPGWLRKFCEHSRGFEQIAAQFTRKPRVLHSVLRPACFTPARQFADLGVPQLATPGDLADWFGISIEHLDWFTDAQRRHGATAIPILQHYSYAFVPKKSGLPRLIEAPKPRLKTMQRRVLHEILDHLPPHPSAHGFVAGRSCLSSAQIHAGEAIVVSIDLKDFFPRTRLSRVHSIYRKLGYPWAVARCLTSLCSTSTPRSVFHRLPEGQRYDWLTRRMFGSPHLAQGAPTSPALANLCAWQLDVRLAGLARSMGANYTRYADDLAFSGDEAFAAKSRVLLTAVTDIAADEGYAINAGKSRVMPRSGCQRMTGLVVNEHLNVSRADFDALKATLHNCRRNDWRAENRSGEHDFRAHLDGRITWVENVNRARGRKLRAMFDEIKW
jgi:RNA-directed DNA polymerase